MIVSASGTPQDSAAMMWDAIKGFAILARTAAPSNPEHAADLLKVVAQMRDRARLMEREELADYLSAAAEVLDLRSGERRG